ncbi:MAG TPA: DUF5919 domain-containing protein [Vicinamibacterales bacterium]|nr:DUF5919 domain-containing protein [Vicinamibacterales bacterium]
MTPGTTRILSDLGMLLGPTTLVALFCAAIGVDPQRTSIYSLAALMFVACCYYRAWISATVPSALVLATSVGLGTIFFMNYGNILLKDTGLIRRFVESSDIQAELGSEIGRATQEIWLFGTNFHISTVDRRPALLEKLQSGVHVRYLILNPAVPNLDVVAADFGQSVDELRQECLKGLRNVLELKQQWEAVRSRSRKPGQLEIKLYDRTPSARMYVFDPRVPSGHSIYVPYMHGFNSPNLPGYLFENTQNGVAQAYFGGLLKLWSVSKPIEDVLAATPALIAAMSQPSGPLTLTPVNTSSPPSRVR